MRLARHVLASIVALSAVTSCSGGGGVPVSPARAVPSAAPVASSAPVSPASSSTGTLTFNIAVPGRTASTARHRRLPAYISASTSAVRITVQGQNETSPEAAQTFSCTSVCTGSFTAPAGVDRVALQLLDSSSAVLSSGVSVVIVFAGQTNSFAFTLDGVVASVDLTLTNSKLPVVPASTGYVLFNARDADGNIITYNGAYADANDAPFVFDVTSSNAAFKLASTTISGPGSVIPYTYDGTAHIGNIIITPSLHPGGSTASTPAFTPATIALVPGISARYSPPFPITVTAVTQTSLSGSFYSDGPDDVIVGNSAYGTTSFLFSIADANYGPAPSAPIEGPTSGIPVVASGTPPNGTLSTDGVFGYATLGSNTFGSFIVAQSSLQSQAGATNPCGTGNYDPLGLINQYPSITAYLFCDSRFVSFPDQVDVTITPQGKASTTKAVASGTPIKIVVQGPKSDTYIETSALTGAVLGPAVYRNGTLVPNVISFGLDAQEANPPVFGESNGSVANSTTPTTPIATFSNPVTAVVADSAIGNIYVLENRAFGMYTSTGRVTETDQLPIGVPFDVIAAPGRGAYIVEADGTIDAIQF